jgi:hypothetical protein
MSSNRHRSHQGGTTPTTEPKDSPGVAQFSVSEVAQFSVSLDMAGPFPWFEYHLNQTDHAQDPLCRT